jgi:hypothetical protein
VQLGLENKKKAMWAAVLGVIAVLVFAYEFIPMFTESSTPTSSAQAAAPIPTRTPTAKAKGRPASTKKAPRVESLDPTLKLDLLAMSEQTRYEGNGRNIFVSQAEEIPIPVAHPNTDAKKEDEDPKYRTPVIPAAPPIPLRFYGFASSPGEAKKIFLKMGEDVFVAGEGEIVDRRYKVMRITNTSVEIQDMVNSGPPQNIPLTQG